MTGVRGLAVPNGGLPLRQHEGAQARYELHEPEIPQVLENVTTGVVPYAMLPHDRHNARELVPRRPLATANTLLVDLGDLLPLRPTRLEFDHGSDGIWLHRAWAIPDMPKHVWTRLGMPRRALLLDLLR